MIMVFVYVFVCLFMFMLVSVLYTLACAARQEVKHQPSKDSISRYSTYFFLNRK